MITYFATFKSFASKSNFFGNYPFRKPKKMTHKQVYAKVNALVDSNIKDLVEVLSSFPKLQTIESCEGNNNTPAWICFQYGDNWKDLTEFVFGYLGKELIQKLGDRISLSVVINSMGLPQGELSIRPGAIKVCTKALRELVY